MAEAAQAPPTFKLVLVGDGGTGKVRPHSFIPLSAVAQIMYGAQRNQHIHHSPHVRRGS